ncbi:MAG: hypothetical protein ABEJ68_04710 [Halobacteriaceae archaeon]
MPTCRNCDEQFDAEELERHEREGMVFVHCPDCGRPLGQYNRHSR